MHGLIGAAHKVVALNLKKKIDAEAVAFDFCSKKVSVYGIDNKIIKEICKLP